MSLFGIADVFSFPRILGHGYFSIMSNETIVIWINMDGKIRFPSFTIYKSGFGETENSLVGFNAKRIGDTLFKYSNRFVSSNGAVRIQMNLFEPKSIN